MNPNSHQTTYMATSHPSSSIYATPPAAAAAESESRFNTGYILSVRGILKLACLLFSFIAFICLVTTPQCTGVNVFLATVTWLVLIMQVTLIIVFVFRLQTKLSGIDFEFLDFFATFHDALYLLIASSVTIHYCRIPGQIAGGAMGILAAVFLIGNVVSIFMAGRKEASDT